MVTGRDAPEQQGAIEKLEASAKGWHSIQLAVLGFIGLCGVLQSSGGGALPMWLQILAAGLVFLALVLSILSISLVGAVAWPIYGARPKRDQVPDEAQVDKAAKRLRTGIALTFLAVAALAIGSAASWWPEEEEADAADTAASVQVATRAGVLCGILAEPPQGSVAVEVQGRTLAVRLDEISSIRPVEGCG